MGIEYPDGHCLNGSPHWFVEVLPQIFQCKHCSIAKWQPVMFYDAVRFGEEIHYIGIQEAYSKRLKRMRRVRSIITVLSAMRLLELEKEEKAEVIAELGKGYEPESNVSLAPLFNPTEYGRGKNSKIRVSPDYPI